MLKFSLKNIFALLHIIIGSSVMAQTSSHGTWTDNNNWTGNYPGTYSVLGGDDLLAFGATDNASVDHNITVGVSVSDRTDMTFNGADNSPGTISIGAGDTLVVFGDVTFANKSMTLSLGVGAVFIVMGNMELENKIVIASDGVLAVSGTINRNTGNTTHSEYSGDGNVYAGGYSGTAAAAIDEDGDSSFSLTDLVADGFPGIKDFIDGDGVVPVDLISFSSGTSLSGTVLSWSTASELNNDHFSIERSENGKDFYAIGNRKGYGTTTETKSYTFTDSAPIANVEYYRLKQVDFDGAFEYSPIIVAYTDNVVDQLEVMAYPNPLAEKLSFRSNRPIRFIRIELINASGKRIANLTQSVEETGLKMEVDLPVLDKGIYYVSYQTSDGKSGVKKLLLN